LSEFAKLYRDVGYPRASEFIERAEALVPTELCIPGNEAQLFEHLRSQFEPLKNLLYEYLEVSREEFLTTLGDFVRAHAEDFTDHI
jgi:hypothetical protein